jgi:protein O-GlcNAc transferase
MDSALRQAIDLQKAGHTDSAIALLEQSLARGNHCAHSQHFLGLLLQTTGRSDAAASALRAALEINPQLGDAWFALGNVLQMSHQNEEALDCFRQASILAPNSIAAWIHRSMMAREMGLYQESWESSAHALTLDPKNPKSWVQTLSILGFLRRYQEGMILVKEAVAVFPTNPEILWMQGNMLTASGRYDEALQSYQSALALDPENPAILNAIGSLHSNHRNAMDAIDYHSKALERDPASPEAFLGLGTAWLRAGYPGDALRYFEQALNVGQSTYDALDGLLLAIQYLDGQKDLEIFDLHRKWNETYARKWNPEERTAREVAVCVGHRALRVGFVSPDLHKHSVARFAAPLFRNWDLTGFELYIYSDVPAIDESSRKMQALGGHWRFTVEMTDDALAEQIRADGIDILVDLAGHTGNHRLLVFARQPASLQVSWLGYPNTTGLDTIAYRISDEIADPQGARIGFPQKPSSAWKMDFIVSNRPSPCQRSIKPRH